jgi:hypothetical protein
MFNDLIFIHGYFKCAGTLMHEVQFLLVASQSMRVNGCLYRHFADGNLRHPLKAPMVAITNAGE